MQILTPTPTLNPSPTLNPTLTLNPVRTNSVWTLCRTLTPHSLTPQSQSASKNQLPVLRRTEPVLLLLPPSSPPALNQFPILGKSRPLCPPPLTLAQFTAQPLIPDQLLILSRKTGSARATVQPPWRWTAVPERFLRRQRGVGPVPWNRVPL